MNIKQYYSLIAIKVRHWNFVFLGYDNKFKLNIGQRSDIFLFFWFRNFHIIVTYF